jgi:hypothetical protein
VNLKLFVRLKAYQEAANVAKAVVDYEMGADQLNVLENQAAFKAQDSRCIRQKIKTRRRKRTIESTCKFWPMLLFVARHI